MNNWIEHDTEADDIVISSKVCLIRNFKDSLFTDKIKVEEARDNVDRVFSILSSKDIGEELTLVKLWETDSDIINIYLEKQLITKELIKRREKSAFIVNKAETLSIMINEEDNLRIQCIVGGLNLKEAYDYIDKIDNYIEEDISYAFSEDLGYLTSSISNVGTGFKASVMLHLPAITIKDEFKNIADGLTKVGMNIESLYVEDGKAVGNIYEVSNQLTLGVKEDDVIQNLEGIIDNIITEERNFRELFDKKHKYELEDKIFRAYGILKNARLLKSKETLELLSYVRLGIEMSLFEIKKSILNKLQVNTRKLVIKTSLVEDSDTIQEELYRAKIVKDILI
ncbi:MAG: protein arginine kinase [Clostridium sp.]|nr:protein arginine kinase [Clostridium sp.]